MDPHFVGFESANGDVMVNVSNVQWVEKGVTDLKGDHASIVFGPGHALTVKGTVEQVTAKLAGKRKK